MNDKTLRDLYGMKHNPFEADMPAEALWEPPEAVGFFARLDMLARTGGFGLVIGEPGTGKSKILQLLATRLEQRGDVVVGVMERPQSGLMDLYRELGTLFGVNLSPANRYGGFQALRSRWRAHMKTTLMRPVLLIDEAQECPSVCLNELRILGSAHFDSHCLLTTVLSGDLRLPERLGSPELLPLDSRVRARLSLDSYTRNQLLAYLHYALEQSGAPELMTEGLIHALCDHADGNLRRLNHMASRLLWVGAENQVDQLDENLYLNLNSPTAAPDRPARKRSAGRQT